MEVEKEISHKGKAGEWKRSKKWRNEGGTRGGRDFAEKVKELVEIEKYTHPRLQEGNPITQQQNRE